VSWQLPRAAPAAREATCARPADAPCMQALSARLTSHAGLPA
jgi:hypothetical protein